MTSAQTKARAIALDTWLKSFTVYSVEDDESSIRLSINGQQIACWGDTSPQGIALLQFDAGHREAATALAAKDAELAQVIKTGFERCADITARAERAEAQLAEARKALEAVQEADVRVKPLEWSGPFKPRENGIPYDHIYADSPLGRYAFSWKGWKENDTPVSENCPGDFFYCASDLDDAKAAAQADYERRILSALTTEPAAPEGRQEAVAVGIFRNGKMVGWAGYPGEEFILPEDTDERRLLYTRPAEQAVTDAMVEAAAKSLRPDLFTPIKADVLQSDDYALTCRRNAKIDVMGKARAALKAAMEEGR